MRCASGTSTGRREADNRVVACGSMAHPGRGYSLIELLVAMAVAMAFLAGAVMAFIQIMRATERAQAELDALANGRHAVESISREITRARYGPGGSALFVGQSADFPYGNGVDDDGDGVFDEESLDGLDNDGDWAADDDRHAQVAAGVSERPRFVGRADLGDGQVDEDTMFSSASLTFRTFPTAFESTGIREVSYYLSQPDPARPGILVQQVRVDAGGPEETVTTGPLAFGVVSFGVLFWDQNARPGKPAPLDVPPYNKYWRRDWTAAGTPGFLPPLPAGVYISITVAAGVPEAAVQVGTGRPINTVTVCSQAAPEIVLNDPRYVPIRESY